MTTESESLADWLDERGAELEQTYGLIQLGIEPETHVPTGIRRLDDAGLLELGVATIVLGHEGDGKSALGLQFLEGCAKGGYRAVGFWPEDPRRFLADRVYAPIIGESASRLRRGRVDDVQGIPARLRAARESAREWAGRIDVNDRRLNPTQLVTWLRRRWTGEHRLAVIDYAQVVADSGSEDSITRALGDLVWECNEFAKDKNAAVVLLSQVRKEVKARGRDQFDRWRYANPGRAPSPEAVEGYRPLSGDGHYAPTLLGQRGRAILSWFRPGLWLREHGANVPDDTAEALILKNNYGESKITVRLRWHGPTTRISDPREP